MKPIFKIWFFILISVLLLFAGNIFVIQRTSKNPIKTLNIRGDTNSYISMIEGKYRTVSSPIKFRILVPLIARLLPFSPTKSLKFITYISLFFSYLFIFVICEKLGLKINSSIIGLLTIWSSTWHLYNYHNPFLIDAFGFLMLCIMLLALLNNNYLLFSIASLLGILARETVAFLVPVWLVTKEWRKSLLLITVSAIIVIIPRLFLVSETDPTLISSFTTIGIGKIQNLLKFGKDVFFSWGLVWFLSIFGIWYLPNDKFAIIAASCISLFVGAILTSLIATDTGRMFSILTPTMAITNAYFYSEIINKNIFWKLLFLVLIILQALTFIPNIIFNSNNFVYTILRIIQLIGGMIFIIFLAVNHIKYLQQKVKIKTIHLLDSMRKTLSHIKSHYR